MEEVTFELTGKEGFTLRGLMEEKTFQKVRFMSKMSEMEKHGMFMRNNKHFNFNGT